MRNTCFLIIFMLAVPACSTDPDPAGNSDAGSTIEPPVFDAGLSETDATDVPVATFCATSADCDDNDMCTTDACEQGVCVRTSPATCSWPAEPGPEAENLTSLGGPIWDNDFYGNLSGAVWNPVTSTLWVCKNRPGTVWAIERGADGSFEIPEVGGSSAEWEMDGDLEAVAQADFAESNTLFVLNEAGGMIVEYDLSVGGQPIANNTWTLTDWLHGDGAEGMTFVPDSFLDSQGFVDETGSPYLSTEGMGGLFFVGHQNGGHLYAFDLNRQTGAHVFVGKYRTGSAESAGLEFDRSSGLLYIWHDAGIDELEIVRLSSTAVDDGRRMDSLLTYSGPEVGVLMGENFEGLALAPVDDCADGQRSLWMTIDGGKLWSLLGFANFPC